MSLNVPPGRTASMPAHIVLKARSQRRLPAMVGLPTTNMRDVSPWKPSLMLVTSMLTMSPCLSFFSPGMPWQTTWLIEMQVVAGYGVMPSGW